MLKSCLQYSYVQYIKVAPTLIHIPQKYTHLARNEFPSIFWSGEQHTAFQQSRLMSRRIVIGGAVRNGSMCFVIAFDFVILWSNQFGRRQHG
jgi:hypothetical protein